MERFYQILGMVLVTVVLGMALKQQGKDITLLLGICACCVALICAYAYIEPVFDFVEHLRSISNLDSELFEVIIKAVGVGMTSEIAMLVCADSGFSALAKTIQIVSIGVILWLSLPLMKSLLELVERIVGAV